VATNAERARGLAENRNVVGITTECRDVVAHPLQRGGLIHQAVVAGCVIRAFGAELGVREKAELPKAVVHADDDSTGFK
jgi:hypothetical protein